ncbi:MAG: mandelate racemase/muconate lactonizing enzyme family protein [Pseudomonadota bacterium]
MRIAKAEIVPLSIPFTDGSAGTGLMPTAWTHLKVTLLRLETDDGIVGWGDGFSYVGQETLISCLREMVLPHVVGQDVEDIPAFNRSLQHRLHLHGRYGITIFAISAIDIALWDIAGKKAGQSVADLLGGAQRRELPAYASLVRYGDPALVETYARKAVSEGYRAVKLHEIALDAIQAGRSGVGDDITLVTDVNCNWSLDVAHEMIPHMKRLGLYWVEEPVFPPDDAETLSALENQHDVAIASGENACTAVEFARTIPAITFTQPSVTKVGGISEMAEICDLAAGQGKQIMPHSPYFGPGYWVTAQIMAAKANCEMFELFYIEPEAWLSPDIPLPKDGVVRVPQMPGIGFEPDQEVLARYAV